MNRIVLSVSALLWVGAANPSLAATPAPPTEGMLHANKPDGTTLGPCPLEHTDVLVRIAGFVARVEVTQTFHNPYEHKIEAVYVFPMSQDAAVDDMTMTVGDRVVRGVIKPREEARKIYEEAKSAGHVASLLDQERPNIFTQSVANIEPGEKVVIRIAYVEPVDWDDAVYHFDFPMVVGPRYNPGGGSAPQPMTNGTPTAQVPDADRITPPVIPEGLRAGHDINLTVELDAGLALHDVASAQHEIDVDYLDGARTQAVIRLKDQKTIPNRDFVLTYTTASEEIGDTLLTHFDSRGGFFTLVLEPPKRVPPQWIVPKEIIFVIDSSGSMSGFPIETAKDAMRRCIEDLNPNDTFNLLTFAGAVGFCFEKSASNTPENRQRALDFLKSLKGSGGTEMMKAIEACLGDNPDPDRVRLVCFMTDGYVGNDMAIIDAVKKNAAETRVFSFGIGTSVNRFLLDGMAHAGRGEVEYVLSPAECEGAAQRFYDRVSTPVLTDVAINWAGLPVVDVQPQLIPDLFSAKPVVLTGRYTAPASGTIRLTGRRGDQRFEREIAVNLPATFSRNDAIASLWARSKVDHLMNQNLAGIQSGTPDDDIKQAITKLGMDYRLMTQFTSFVAVEELTMTRDGEPVKVQVPVEMPQGVSYEGVFGERFGAGAVAQLQSLGYAGSSSTRTRRAVGKSVPAATRGYYEEGRFTDGDGLGKREPVAAIEQNMELTPEEKRERLLAVKLAKDLHGLAGKLDEHGNYSEGKLKVTSSRVEVTVNLADLSEETMKTLKDLGFEVLAGTRTAKLVIGIIDVEHLEDLALLAGVRRVDLPNF